MVKYEDIVDQLDNDPVARTLIEARIPARLSYSAPDGSPRVVPVSYVWDGAAFVFATWPTAAKVRALELDPRVAMTIDSNDFTPYILLVRGRVTSMERVDGIPDVYVEASRRIVGEDRMEEWETNVRRDIPEMIVITITPDWIKLIDFVTRFPGRKNP